MNSGSILKIINAKIVNEGHVFEGEILIEKDRISQIGNEITV